MNREDYASHCRCLFSAAGCLCQLRLNQVADMARTTARERPGYRICNRHAVARSRQEKGSARQSSALMADSKQTELCTYLSAILLAGSLTEFVGWLVVGRSRGGLGYGADHCQRGG